MDIPQDGSADKLERVLPQKVFVTAVYPRQLRVSTHFGFLAFIAIVKTWVGFWEGIVVYASLLAMIWTVLGISISTPAAVAELTDEKGSIWAETPALWFLLTGCLTNLFLVARFCANAAKGSFGLPDQYVSLTTALPGFAAAVLGLGLFHTAFMFTPETRV